MPPAGQGGAVSGDPTVGDVLHAHACSHGSLLGKPRSMPRVTVQVAGKGGVEFVSNPEASCCRSQQSLPATSTLGASWQPITMSSMPPRGTPPAAGGRRRWLCSAAAELTEQFAVALHAEAGGYFALVPHRCRRLRRRRRCSRSSADPTQPAFSPRRL